MKVSAYNINSGEKRTVEMPDEVFNVEWNPDLVHQVAVSMQANRRPNVAHTKERGEVRGGGKKPWRQKGTGKARHGSVRSPIWVGGSITFGPRSERNFSKKINKKMRLKALFSTLSKKYEDGELIFAEGFSPEVPSTKRAQELLDKLEETEGVEGVSKHRKNVCTLISDSNSSKVKSFNNIENATVEEVRNINPLLLLEHKYIIVLDPDSMVEFLKDRYQSLKNNKKAAKT